MHFKIKGYWSGETKTLLSRVVIFLATTYVNDNDDCVNERIVWENSKQAQNYITFSDDDSLDKKTTSVLLNEKSTTTAIQAHCTLHKHQLENKFCSYKLQQK